MNRFSTVFLTVWFCMSAEIATCTAQETTWTSPPVSTQLDMDNTLVPFGKGSDLLSVHDRSRK